MLETKFKDEYGIEPFELPLICKVYDFNPDFPGFGDWLLDIASYKEISGYNEKKKKENNLRDRDADFSNPHCC